jgi:hypothetical protein
MRIRLAAKSVISSIKVTMDLCDHLMREIHEAGGKKSQEPVFSEVNGNVTVTEQQKRESDKTPNSLRVFGSGAWI